MSKFINKSEETNYNAKKKYGQNFLEDNDLLLEIVESASLTDETEVIEIGPGLGFLTDILIKKSKKITAFEIDKGLIPILTKKFGDNDNFELINEDFLAYDLNKIVEGKKNIKVVANIPYYITSPIISRLLEFRSNISEIYLMVQKEVAERIASKPNSKNMSILTHSVQFFAEAEYLFTVKKEMFTPVPKVDSAFLKIKVLNDDKYIGQITEEKYFKYLKAAFSNKRKSITNNMLSLGNSKEKVANTLEIMGKQRLTRTEEFSVQEFINFIELLEKQ